MPLLLSAIETGTYHLLPYLKGISQKHCLAAPRDEYDKKVTIESPTKQGNGDEYQFLAEPGKKQGDRSG